VRQLAAALDGEINSYNQQVSKGGSKLPHSKGFAAQWQILLEFGLPTIS